MTGETPRYTIILSGPKRNASQVQNALTRAGLAVLEGEAGTDPHGLPDAVDGGEPLEPVAFLAVTGEDVDAAHSAVEPFQWTIRAHRHASPPAPEDPVRLLAATVAEMRAEIERLKVAR